MAGTARQSIHPAVRSMLRTFCAANGKLYPRFCGWIILGFAKRFAYFQWLSTNQAAPFFAPKK